MKKTLSVILALSLFLSVFCINCFAVEKGECGENLRWEYSAVLGEMHIYGSGAMTDFSENGAPWNSYAGTVSSLYLPSSLTHIGSYAFQNFASLKEIDFPSALTSIGEGAFKGAGLTEVVLPYKIAVLEAETFCECDALERIEFKTVTYSKEVEIENEGETVSSYKTVSEGLRKIGNNAFEFCSALDNVELPKTLESLGSYAFSECTALSSVKFISETFKSIGEGAFSYCSSLQKIELPTGITKINARTFRGCALKRIDLPKTVTSVGDAAFAFCEYLTKIDVYANDCAFFAGENTTPDKAKLCVSKTAAKAISYAKKYSKPYAVLCKNRALRHNYILTAVKATSARDGYIQNKCSKCAYIQKTVIKRIKGVSLLKSDFVYNGKRQHPSASQIRVLDYNSKVIPSSEYSVRFNLSSSAVGAHSLTVTFKGSKYSGKLTKAYYIIPKGTSIKSLSAAKGALKVSWVKQRTQTNGYHIVYSADKSFKSGVKTVLIKNNNTAAYTLKKLARNRAYYVKIRTYKSVGGKKYYSAWSKAKWKVTK